MNQEGFGRKWLWHNWGTMLAFARMDWRKTRKVCNDFWCPGQHSNWGVPKYKSTMLYADQPVWYCPDNITPNIHILVLENKEGLSSSLIVLRLDSSFCFWYGELETNQSGYAVRLEWLALRVVFLNKNFCDNSKMVFLADLSLTRTAVEFKSPEA
jgi:hypothetical protein